jgi:predicted DNA-binding protein
MAKQPKKSVGRPKIDGALESQIAVRVSAEVRERLEAKAQQLERSVGWVLRKAVEEWLERNG